MRRATLLSPLLVATWTLTSTACHTNDQNANAQSFEFLVSTGWNRETERHEFTVYGIAEFPAAARPGAERLQAAAQSISGWLAETSPDGRALIFWPLSDEDDRFVLMPDWMCPEVQVAFRGRYGRFLGPDKLLVGTQHDPRIYDLRSGTTAPYPFQASVVHAMTRDGWLAAAEDATSARVIVVSDVMSGAPRKEFEVRAQPGTDVFWLHAGQRLVVRDGDGHTVIYDRQGMERCRVDGHAGAALGDDAFIVYRRDERSIVYRLVGDTVEPVGTLPQFGVAGTSPSGNVIQAFNHWFAFGPQWTMTRSGLDRNCRMPPEGNRGKNTPVLWLRFDPHAEDVDKLDPADSASQ